MMKQRQRYQRVCRLAPMRRQKRTLTLVLAMTLILSALLGAPPLTLEAAALSPAMPEVGSLVYSEDFDDWGDTELLSAPPRALGWVKLTEELNGAESESDVMFALRDGRLYFDNYDAPTDLAPAPGSRRGEDAYYAIYGLWQDQPYNTYHVMTLEYDLEYTAAESGNACAALLTDYCMTEPCYTICDIRIGGEVRSRVRYYGSWRHFSEPGSSSVTTLSDKLLPLPAPPADGFTLQNVPLTVRIQRRDLGPAVYLKTADMSEFVLISEPHPLSEGSMYWGWGDDALVLKIGGGAEGYIDNIRLWLGTGEGADVTVRKFATYYN